MTVGDWLNTSIALLEKAGVTSARLDCLILAEAALAKDRAWLLAHPEFELNADQISTLQKMLERRSKHEPIAHILGRIDFYGLELMITPDVLVPRPETEALVTFAAECTPQGARVLEVGTGSGAIAIALKHTRPDLKLSASEISETALDVAKKNAGKYSMDDIEWLQCNLMDDISGQFECIIANLPYVATDANINQDATYEPDLALFGGKDGLDLYKRFFDQIPSHLAPKATVIVEADPWQHEDLVKLAQKADLTPIHWDKWLHVFAE